MRPAMDRPVSRLFVAIYLIENARGALPSGRMTYGYDFFGARAKGVARFSLEAG